MNNNGTNEQILQLKKEREEHLEELEQLRQQAKSKVDADIGEGDPEQVERDLAVSMIQFHERRLAAIEQALQEVQQGTYGICERCGQPIDPARLEVIPEATLCIKCKQVAEQQSSR